MSKDIRLLNQDDFAALDEFLKPRTAESYFIRSNMRRGGLVYHGQPFQAQYLGAFESGKIIGVISYTWMSALISYAENLETLTSLAEVVAPNILDRGGAICACLGLADQVEVVVETLKIPSSSFRRDEAETLYSLNVDGMLIPDILKSPDYYVRHAKESDLDELVSWRVSYDVEVLNATAGQGLEERVRNDVIQRTGLGELFVLEMRGKLLSLCGAGGSVPEAIMIAPLWTPHELRGHGYGQAATAGAIQFLARANPSLRQAILYTANPIAAHVYEKIGFKKIASWRLALLKEDFRLRKSENI